MHADFWLTRWQKNELGWQQAEVNPYLQQFFPRLQPCSCLLVPLCGASTDLWWLASQGSVVGAELSELACQQLFAQELTEVQHNTLGLHRSWQLHDLLVWQGDFFTLTSAHIGLCQAIYDRAALIALPADMRPPYVQQLRALCPHAKLLLLTLEYPQAELQGPPFSVEQAEVERLFAGCQLQLLARQDISQQGFGRRKLLTSRLHEVVWLVEW